MSYHTAHDATGSLCLQIYRQVNTVVNVTSLAYEFQAGGASRTLPAVLITHIRHTHHGSTSATLLACAKDVQGLQQMLVNARALDAEQSVRSQNVRYS